MERVCPTCGTSSEKTHFDGDFCEKCSRISINCPDKVPISQCSVCKKLAKYKSTEEGVLAAVKGDYASAKYDVPNAILTVIFKKGGIIIERKKIVEIGIRKEICSDCNKRAGGYYEAIVQIRGKEERMARAIKILTEKLERLTFISKVVDRKEGSDLYTGDRKMTAQAIAEAGYKASRSEKLAGERDGKRLYRTSFCVRLD
jgi:NMD protein affecting ribosome stability and mRNA decay